MKGRDLRNLEAARELAAELAEITDQWVFPELTLEEQSRVIKLALHHAGRKIREINLCWGRVFVEDKYVLKTNLNYDGSYKAWALTNHWWLSVGNDVIIDYRLGDRLQANAVTIPHGSFAKRDFIPAYQYLERGTIEMNLNEKPGELLEKYKTVL